MTIWRHTHTHTDTVLPSIVQNKESSRKHTTSIEKEVSQQHCGCSLFTSDLTFRRSFIVKHRTSTTMSTTTAIANCYKRDFVTHTRRVQNLYKRCVRNEESFFRDKAEVRYSWAIVRAEFEKHRNVKDLRVAKMLIEDGERRLFEHQHPKPKKFIFSPGGLMFEREHIYSDCHMDIWHPLEKAQYPYYYERREQLKKEFCQNWEKNHPDSKHFDH